LVGRPFRFRKDFRRVDVLSYCFPPSGGKRPVELDDMSRKIIQIASSSHPIDGNVVHALCDDGSLWALHGTVWDPVCPLPQTSEPRGKAPRQRMMLSRRQLLCCWIALLIATCLGVSALDVDDNKFMSALGLAAWQQG